MGTSSKISKSKTASPKLMKSKNKENIPRKPVPKSVKSVSNEKSTFQKNNETIKKQNVESISKVIQKKKGKTKVSNESDTKNLTTKIEKKKTESTIDSIVSLQKSKNNENVFKNKRKESSDITDITKSITECKNNEKLVVHDISKKKKNKKNESVVGVTKSIIESKSKEDFMDNNARLELRSNPSIDKSTNKKVLSKKQGEKRKQIELEESDDKEENNLNLSRKHILQCISAIFHLKEEQLIKKNPLFSNEARPIFMQVTCIRIPKASRRQMRVLLPHSIVLEDDDVVLFVRDLERGRRKDNEKTVDYYKELLEKCGCTKIKNIIPINQVKTEYDQYELKRKLLGSYDYFLVDGRIAGHMCHLLGSIFTKKRKQPTPIKMDKDLKEQIDRALRKTAMHIHSLSDTHIIQVGHTFMKKKHILENVLTTCKFLSKNYPGGWSNIRALRLKTPVGIGLPIYMTLKNKNNVTVPQVKPKRPKAYHNVEGDLSTYVGKTKVTVTPEGDVIVTHGKSRSTKEAKKKEDEETEAEEETEKEENKEIEVEKETKKKKKKK